MLQETLRENGYSEVFLACDLIKSEDKPAKFKDRPHEEWLYGEIEKLMPIMDFNIFILFAENEHNISVLVELTTFLKNEIFSQKSKKTIALFPRGYYASMLKGLISQQKLNIFEYDSVFEIPDYVKIFVLRNQFE